MIVVKNKADCCGCTACYSVCPKKAIRYAAGSRGLFISIRGNFKVYRLQIVRFCLSY